MIHFKHTGLVNLLNNILVITDHFVRKSMAKIFIGLLSLYGIIKKETIIQLLAENNGKINMNECNHCTKEADIEPLPSCVPVTLIDNRQISHSKSPIISASTNIKKASGYLFCDHNSWLLESRETGEDRE